MPDKKTILFAHPGGPWYTVARALIGDVAEQCNARIQTVFDGTFRHPALDDTGKQFANADLLIADITGANPGVTYLAGYAHGLRKPVLMIYETLEGVPFDVPLSSLRYSLNLPDDFRKSLQGAITGALAAPDESLKRPTASNPGPTVFISYSHRDKEYLDRLLVHLRPLEMEQRIEVWDDTQITPGQDWQREIEGALRRASVAVLLVSPDYLASEFVVRDELPRLLKSSQDTAIIPVVVSPCGFQRHPSLSALQAVNDFRTPLSGMTEYEQAETYEKIVDAIGRYVADARPPTTGAKK
jgi:TIR domain